MPERPGDPPPRARALTDRERAEAARLREIASNAPPLPPVRPSFPTEAPWSAGLAELSGLWLSVSCKCGAHTGLPFRYLAAAHGWKTHLIISDIIARLKCRKCGERPSSVELVEDPTTDAVGVPKSRAKHRLRLI
jgi:hypothetical protein